MAREISENIEEYLETLYKFGSKDSYVSTTTLSKELGIAPGSVTQMLKKLEDIGYIEYVPYKGAFLTAEGNKIAQKITRKHRILEKFLKDVLNIKDENLHAQACQMEHSLSDEAERAICHMLEHPDTCPDDNIIPACDFNFANCEDCLNDHVDIEDIEMRDFNLFSISQLEKGEEGEVLFLRGSDDALAQCVSAGITIGSLVRIEESESSDIFNVRVNDLSVELPRGLANNIFINTYD
ncbi:MAG: metal-dependent transcriptional regulator [Methanobrevibacter sp.]|nr:metal-dependent transcriptional regulator [Methanobrevibacter sp.]